MNSLDRLSAALADRYILERELGAGGMATVYLAEDLKHERKVAIKVLKPELAAVLGAERFLQEIKTTAALQHPHILPLFDSGVLPDEHGQPTGCPYYVMPYIEGETIREKLTREGQFGVEEAVRITIAVADALDYAHRRGVIHRDIKPENLLLHDGRPMVMDFGIALAVSAAAGGRMTETGLSLGTPHYMSPEQATADKQITARSDVYSLASVLYEMLAGEPPHSGGSAQAIIMKIVTDVPRPVSELRKSVPPGVAAALGKALEKVPADRFETAKAFAEALADPAVEASDPRTGAPGRASRRPWWGEPRVVATAALGAVAGAALAAAVLRPAPAGVPVEYDVGLPDSAGLLTAAQDVGFTVAPAGDFVVYETVRDGRGELWYRSLLDATVRRIPGSDGGSQPVLSPDGRRIAFFRLGDGGWTIEVLPVEGGTATTLGRGIGIVKKLFWPAADSVLLLLSDGKVARWFDPERGAGTSVVMRYCESQSPIPGTNDVLCGGGGLKWGYRVALGDSVTEARLWRAEDSSRVFGSSFHVVDGRYLTYVSVGADLFAAPVDLASGRVGRAVRLASGLGLADYTGNASYAIAASGTLVYAQMDNRSIGSLVRVSETGIDTLPVGRAAFVTFGYSPDARRLAAVVEGLDGQELRIYDLSSGRYQTWIRRPSVTHPAWSPSGDQLVFSNFDSLFMGSPDRSGAPEFLFHVPGGADVLQWMTDGRVIVMQYESNGIWALRIDRRPVTVDTLFTGNGFTWPSVDGRWVAYTDAGWTEAWIEPLPRDGRRFPVAAGNLADIQWLAPLELGLPITVGGQTHLERVTVDPGADPPVRNRGRWADAPGFRDTNGPSFARAPGRGLLYLQGAPDRPATYLRVVRNWVDRMKQAVDEANR